MTVAYGFLFGVFPSLVAEHFGIHGLSQNWGAMTVAPVISGNVFNLLYGNYLLEIFITRLLILAAIGSIYDRHSFVNPDGERQCLEGLKCYSTAYWVTFGASVAGVAFSLWSIRHEHVVKAKERKAASHHGREA